MRQSSLVLVDPQVNEVERAREDEHRGDVLNEAVNRPERDRAEHREVQRSRPENPEIEVGIEAASPEDQRAEKEDEKADENELMGESSARVIAHPFLDEGVLVGASDAITEAVQAVLVAADLE